MLWNDPKKLDDGTREPRRMQPQSGVEYSAWCEQFPDPQAPSTHVVVYHWEDSPNKNAPRVLVIGSVPKTEAGAPVIAAPVKPEAPQANDGRRRELMSMGLDDFKTTYGIALGISMPNKISRPQAVAQILEKESTVTA